MKLFVSAFLILFTMGAYAIPNVSPERAAAVLKRAIAEGRLASSVATLEKQGFKKVGGVRSIRLASAELFGVRMEKCLVLTDFEKDGDRISLGAFVEIGSDGKDRILSIVDLSQLENLLLDEKAPSL